MTLSLYQRLERRWERRDEEAEHVAVQATIEVSASCTDVWDFLTAPECNLLLDDSVVKVFIVPGTQVDALGEQMCVVAEEGERLTVSIWETVAIEVGALLVTRLLTGPVEIVQRIVLSEEAKGKTVLTFQLGARLPFAAAKKARSELQANLNQVLRRIRAAIDSGVRFPSNR